jgi:hypothetical protein
MTLARYENLLDRTGGVFLLAIALMTGGALAALAVVGL